MNRRGVRTRSRLGAGAPGVRLLMLAFGVLSLAQSAVTTALTIYGFTEAGALGAGLVGARVLPSMVAGVFGGKVAARTRPAFVRSVDEIAGQRVARVELLGRVPLLRPLRVDALEQASAALLPVEVPAGADVVRQGDPHAQRWFLVEDGMADVLLDGWHVATLGPGSSFGEKALLRSVPRAATVRARTPLRLLALDRLPFLAAVTGDPSGAVPQPDRGMPSAPAELLRLVPLLTALEQRELEELAELGHERAVGAGEDVIREGEPADRFYVLLEGKAAVYSGQRLRGILAPGDHFGEIALLHHVPRTATVRGMTDLRLFSLDRDALLGASPDVLTIGQLV